jgi:hypothetical protein
MTSAVWAGTVFGRSQLVATRLLVTAKESSKLEFLHFAALALKS